MAVDPAIMKLCNTLAEAMVRGTDEQIASAFKALAACPPEPRREAINSLLEDDDETLLHTAAREAQAGIVHELISWGANVNAPDQDDVLALTGALWANRWDDTQEVSLALLAAGSKCNYHDRFGMTPLHHAAATGSPDVVNSLIAAGADVNALDARDGHETPLHNAAQEGNAAVIPILLGAGATPNLINADGLNDLYLAAQYGHREAALLLLQARCDVDLADGMGRTPLHHAAYNGDIELFDDLVTAGADPLATDAHGLSAMDIMTAFTNPDDEAAVSRFASVEELDLSRRLTAWLAVIMQNNSGSPDYLESSFIAILHEENFWRRRRCDRLCHAVRSLASDGAFDDGIPRIIARTLHDAFEYVVVAGTSHLNPNDAFKVRNIEPDDLIDELDDFKLAFIRYFTGEHGYPDELTVEKLVDLELASRSARKDRDG